MITSVWSHHGHRFISDGGEDTESCLTCGAMYYLTADDPDDPSHGRYHASNGDDPDHCTHNTSMDHGYETTTTCNCVACA